MQRVELFDVIRPERDARQRTQVLQPLDVVETIVTQIDGLQSRHQFLSGETKVAVYTHLRIHALRHEIVHF